MADEQTPIAQNWRLLIVAFAPGLVVMVVYNLHIAKVRSGSKGEMVVLTKAIQDVDVGKTLPGEAITSVEVPKDVVRVLGDVVPYDEKATYVGKKVQVRVRDGTLLRITNIEGYDTEGGLLGARMVSFTMPMDTNRIPGEVLAGKGGIWVNVVANMPSRQANELTATRLLKSAHVIGIGDKAVEPSAIESARGPVTQGSYRKITIEVDEKMADKLNELMAKAIGPPWLEMLAKNDHAEAPILTPEAEKLLKPRSAVREQP